MFLDRMTLHDFGCLLAHTFWWTLRDFPPLSSIVRVGRKTVEKKTPFKTKRSLKQNSNKRQTSSFYKQAADQGRVWWNRTTRKPCQKCHWKHLPVLFITKVKKCVLHANLVLRQLVSHSQEWLTVQLFDHIRFPKWLRSNSGQIFFTGIDWTTSGVLSVATSIHVHQIRPHQRCQAWHQEQVGVRAIFVWEVFDKMCQKLSCVNWANWRVQIMYLVLGGPGHEPDAKNVEKRVFALIW